MTIGAVSWPLNASGVAMPVLEVDPANSGAGADIFITYRSGWVEVTSDDASLPLPADCWMDGLFKVSCLEWAKGYDKSDTGTIWERMGAFAESQFFRSFKRRDGAIQDNLGVVSGTDIRPRHRGTRTVDIIVPLP
jgi:hypothetical protein